MLVISFTLVLTLPSPPGYWASLGSTSSREFMLLGTCPTNGRTVDKIAGQVVSAELEVSVLCEFGRVKVWKSEGKEEIKLSRVSMGREP
ncbi:hypothetical protein BC827DRAFT_1190810 [Russula dissimulans]|nr:hypothetical protein BC827DRAFT_1190810 [Russula dissimulans]